MTNLRQTKNTKQFKNLAKKKVRKNKYKRIHKGRTRFITYSPTAGNLTLGYFGVLIMKPTWIDEKKIESGIKHIKKYLTKRDKLWIRIFPDLPITKKPTGIRMGKGKGKPTKWVAKVQAGTLVFEVSNINIKRINLIKKNLQNNWSIGFKIVKDTLPNNLNIRNI